ncbi:MAG: hypothetical protein JWL64_2790 [Frankiales bacterium]|nr:hypothetical protein [Frankiales bacterium]
MDVKTHRDELLSLERRLMDEFDEVLAAGAVLRCVARCRDELLLIGVRQGLVEAVEAMARHRLRERLPLAV